MRLSPISLVTVVTFSQGVAIPSIAHGLLRSDRVRKTPSRQTATARFQRYFAIGVCVGGGPSSIASGPGAALMVGTTSRLLSLRLQRRPTTARGRRSEYQELRSAWLPGTPKPLSAHGHLTPISGDGRDPPAPGSLAPQFVTWTKFSVSRTKDSSIRHFEAPRP